MISLRRWIIRSPALPDFVREFAAATLTQGAARLTAYHLLLPFIDLRLPRRIVTWLCRTVGRQQGIDFGELEQPLESYPTLDAFFTRGLRPGARTMATAPDAVVSPADAEVTSVGTIERGTMLQAKGMPYRVADLLGERSADEFEGGTFVVLYLRPADCHRIFCPLDCEVYRASALPGGEMPVAPETLGLVPGVYVHNKRLVQRCRVDRGEFALVAVGAYKVGRITASYDGELGTASRMRRSVSRDYRPGRRFRRGDWIATFHLGSTIVLLFPRGSYRMRPGLAGTRVKYGESIGHWPTAAPIGPNDEPGATAAPSAESRDGQTGP